MSSVVDPRMARFIEAAGDLAEAQILGEVTDQQIADAFGSAMLAARANPDLVVESMLKIAQRRMDQLETISKRRKAYA